MFKLIKYCLSVFVLSISIGSVHAAMIPVGIDISGSLTTSTVDAFGSITSTGTESIGGINSNTDLSAGGVVNSIFTDIGDGLSLLSNVTGNGGDGVAYGNFGNGFLVNLAMAIANTTADTQRVTLDFGFNIFALAGGSDLDSFIESILFLNDSVVSLFSEEHTSDTNFGDLVNGDEPDPLTYGASQGTSGTTSYVFDILAGDTLNLAGGSSLRGGAFAANTNFIGDADFSLTIASIENLNTTQPPNPNPVPEPYTLGMFALGLALLLRKQLVR
jgi:hypothetical protein